MKKFFWALPLASTCVLFCATAFAADNVVEGTTDFAQDLSKHWLVTLMAALIPMARTIFSDDTVKLPVWAAKKRVLWISILSFASTLVEQLMHGIDIKNALVALTVTAGPSLGQELIKALFGSNEPTGGAGDDGKPDATTLPKISVRAPAGYSVKLSSKPAWKSAAARSLAIGLCVVALPGCGAFPRDVQNVVKNVATEIADSVQEAMPIIDALHSIATIFFLAHPNADAQARVEQAFVDANLALETALRAGEGANAAANQDYNAAFGSFRAAYSNIVKLMNDLGIASTKASSGRMSVARNGGGITDMPIPRAALERK